MSNMFKIFLKSEHLNVKKESRSLKLFQVDGFATVHVQQFKDREEMVTDKSLFHIMLLTHRHFSTCDIHHNQPYPLIKQ